jgi:biotin carboxylase
MKTLLFVGAGRYQRRAIGRVRELGCRVVAVDRNPEAPGFAEADAFEAVDFLDVPAVADVGRRHMVDGVVTAFADRAVPVVAAVAEILGLPGIGSETARLTTNKLAMRQRLAETGLPQPRFAAVRTREDGAKALADVGLPAVVKPADSAGQRGISLLGSPADLEACLPLALAESQAGEAIVESFHDGLEVNGLLVARGGEPELITLSDRLRPDGAGFGVALAHVYPSSLTGDALAEAERVARDTVRATGLADGVAYPQLLVTTEGRVLLLEIAARVPAGQMDQIARLGTGIDLIEVSVRQALGEDLTNGLVRRSVDRPVAISFLTASPGPLPTGTVLSLGGLERARSSPGVVDAQLFLAPGDAIRPVQVDGDRRGFVIALGETGTEALERALAAAALIEVQVA